MNTDEIRRSIRVNPTWTINEREISIGYYLKNEYRMFQVDPINMAQELKRQGMVLNVIPMGVIYVEHDTREEPITESVQSFVMQFDQKDFIDFLVHYEIGKVIRLELEMTKARWAELIINGALNN